MERLDKKDSKNESNMLIIDKVTIKKGILDQILLVIDIAFKILIIIIVCYIIFSDKYTFDAKSINTGLVNFEIVEKYLKSMDSNSNTNKEVKSDKLKESAPKILINNYPSIFNPGFSLSDWKVITAKGENYKFISDGERLIQSDKENNHYVDIATKQYSLVSNNTYYTGEFEIKSKSRYSYHYPLTYGLVSINDTYTIDVGFSDYDRAAILLYQKDYGLVAEKYQSINLKYDKNSNVSIRIVTKIFPNKIVADIEVDGINEKIELILTNSIFESAKTLNTLGAGWAVNGTVAELNTVKIY